jgi:hypothetical protein
VKGCDHRRLRKVSGRMSIKNVPPLLGRGEEQLLDDAQSSFLKFDDILFIGEIGF